MKNNALLTKVAPILCLSLLLSACSTTDENIPTKNRIALLGEQAVSLKQSQVNLSFPDAIFNNDWLQTLGLPFNDTGNLEAVDNLNHFKKIFIGDTQDGLHEVTMKPIIVSGKAFFYTVESKIIALDLESDKILWEQEVILNKDDDDINPRGGGLATDGRAIYVTTTSGLIAAFNSETGKQIWRIENKVPLSAAPTLSQGILYVIDRDNRLQVYDAKRGQPLWDYRGLPELVAHSQVASPAVFGSVLIAPFTSGEVTAINIKTKSPVWEKSLTNNVLSLNSQQFDTISSEIIISNQTIFASVPSGMTVAFDGPTGRYIWRNKVGAFKNMLSAGNGLFLIDTDAILYAFDKSNGGVIWQRKLQKYEDIDNQTDLVTWTSPIMSNGKIILFSNIGKSLIIDAKNGKVLERHNDMPETIIDPIIAKGKIFLHAKDGYAYIFDSN